MEIERVFIVENLPELRARFVKLGFILVNQEEQVNNYLDYNDFRVFRGKGSLRFRSILEVGSLRFVRGEITLSKRRVDENGNDIRELIDAEMSSLSNLGRLFRRHINRGLLHSYRLIKSRKEYSRHNANVFKEHTHIEIDANIKVGEPPFLNMIRLEDTVQLCIESNNLDAISKIDEISEEIGFGNLEPITINYLERYEEIKKGKRIE